MNERTPIFNVNANFVRAAAVCPGDIVVGPRGRYVVGADSEIWNGGRS